MKLNELLAGIEYEATNFCDAEITHLSCDSRDAGEGALFFCFAGGKSDGHDFAAAAAEKGAAAFVCERQLATDKPQIVVKDARKAMGLIAGAFFGNPIKNMKLVCITGTNGKTTTSYILRGILTEHGVKTGLLGTTAYFVGEEKRPADLTTPDPIKLHGLFFDMYKAGCKVVIMELSAHAIALQKMAGVVADITILTNITQDHLDFFETMEEYKKTKLSFFTSEHTRFAVVNADDAAGEELYLNATIPTVSYGADKPSDVFGIDLTSGINGIKYVLNLYDKLWEIDFALAGKFNMYNTMAAATAARFLGVPIETIAAGIKSTKRVEGRLDTIKLTCGAIAVIDYAHTPDGVESVLTALNAIKKGRLITVFGCGGDRDSGKRPLMGKAAAAHSDGLIITSDNPRSEDPEKIIDDIISGLPADTKYMREADRKRAILAGVAMAGAGDILAVLGKGAETTQEINGEKMAFSDYQIITEANG